MKVEDVATCKQHLEAPGGPALEWRARYVPFFTGLGVWLWMACLITGATATVIVEAPQIIDQYTSAPE